jgi:hypothetical protein
MYCRYVEMTDYDKLSFVPHEKRRGSQRRNEKKCKIRECKIQLRILIYRLFSSTRNVPDLPSDASSWNRGWYGQARQTIPK